jgi:hypothetical protein
VSKTKQTTTAPESVSKPRRVKLQEPRRVTLQEPAHRQAVIREIEVDDPYEKGAKLRVARNIREHPLHILHANKRIDGAQLLAGEMFRRRWERAAIGASKSIDLSAIRVDGGGPVLGTITDGAAESIEWLNRVARYPGCGKVGFAILSQICGEGRGIAETADRWLGAHVVAGSRGQGFVIGRLIEALDALIECEGMVAVGRRKRNLDAGQE